ncbi:hypothetical protein F3Y22_tig00111947pilonHSYRG00115 [Hibiscus syriacus]|uniref:Uncharacterized protein n=1 Tax=Hibiscus syriacus TaxID=106335 RepID=A0A6A2XNR0_HIBSY|nr:hypothetical protein F3Y22_tig00111947pilonHSYRG00115 [Hibiscus syriacus]
MLRVSSYRNQRSKGLKVKHALQICVLVAICIWLLYQVMHNSEKKADYEKSTKEVIMLGRKDLPQAEETAIKDLRVKDEGEEAGKIGEEDNKLEETEAEEEAGHAEDSIDGEKENEQRLNTKIEEKESEDLESEGTKENVSKDTGLEESKEDTENKASEVNAEDGENKALEGKENTKESREKENNHIGEESNAARSGNKEIEKSGGEIENLGASDDHVRDGADRKNGEAREEHYKGGNSNQSEQLENRGKNEFDQEKGSNNSEATNVHLNKSNVQENETAENYQESGNESTDASVTDANSNEHQNGREATSNSTQNENDQQLEKSKSGGDGGRLDLNAIATLTEHMNGANKGSATSTSNTESVESNGQCRNRFSSGHEIVLLGGKSDVWSMAFIAIDGVALGPVKGMEFGESPKLCGDSPHSRDVWGGSWLLETSSEAVAPWLKHLALEVSASSIGALDIKG